MSPARPPAETVTTLAVHRQRRHTEGGRQEPDTRIATDYIAGLIKISRQFTDVGKVRNQKRPPLVFAPFGPLLRRKDELRVIALPLEAMGKTQVLAGRPVFLPVVGGRIQHDTLRMTARDGSSGITNPGSHDACSRSSVVRQNATV